MSSIFGTPTSSVGLHINHSRWELFSQNPDFTLRGGGVGLCLRGGGGGGGGEWGNCPPCPPVPPPLTVSITNEDVNYSLHVSQSKRAMAVKLLEPLESVG